MGAACRPDGDRPAVASADEGGATGSDLGPGQLGVWSVGERRRLHRNPVDRLTGTLPARGSQVVSLNGHPRLLDTTTGHVVAEWPEVTVPEKTLCLGVEHVPTPIAAVGADGTRPAVAQEAGIAVVELPECRPA
ncbi:hypothetical protein ACIQF6_03305 [Kitasatospora sp. NPDC092948]|uniref:hypothetical protein n=1 Tax=Kitasatospora sp. NPDC092948 TaxID=3364088 RepID=UPI0038181246